jgi:hypothetical protein
MPRKSITDMIPDMEAPAEAPAPAATPPPPADATPKAARRRLGRQEAATAKAPDARPTARDLAAPARQAVAREALKVDVPAELALLRRLHARRIDTGQDIRDQVAIALDEALTREGY